MVVKIGNLKLGAVKSGRVVAFDSILVTGASKNGKENFSAFPGFNEDGEKELHVSFPYNSPELNFEVNFVSFVKIDEVEYIAKAPAMGEDILAYPINAEDFDKNPLNLGALTEESKEKLSMEKTGLLKTMIPEVSSFGEVFYLKTKSIHTINAIQSQLKSANILLNGIANYPFTLKAYRKDVSNGNTITYVSVGLDMERLRDYKESDENFDDELDYDAFEKMYIESLKTDTEIPKVSEDKEIIVMNDNFVETISLKNEKEQFLEMMEEADVDQKHQDFILKHANANTIATIIKYYDYLKNVTNNRKYASRFTKDIESGMKPFQMIQAMTKSGTAND